MQCRDQVQGLPGPRPAAGRREDRDRALRARARTRRDFYKKDITLEILGPVGDIVGEWIIKGAFCKVAKFGDYDWSQGESAISLGVTLAMDYCVCNF